MKFPRIQLSDWPTPYHPLQRISQAIGVQVYAKREDLSRVALGGNKVRKMEYVLGSALAAGADTIITTGAFQSNHCRIAAATAASRGLDCYVLLAGDVPAEISGNLLLDHLFGATVLPLQGSGFTDESAAMESLARDLSLNGRKPFVVPLGGNHLESIIAFMECARELAAQADDAGHTIDALVLATGTASTLVGLWLGAQQYLPGTEVIGVQVSHTKEIIDRRVDQLLELARTELDLNPVGRPVTTDNYVGPGYGMADERTQGALQTMARQEGIALDSTYTAKAFAGLLAEVDVGLLKEANHIAFIHTGGIPELFARPPASLGIRRR